MPYARVESYELELVERGDSQTEGLLESRGDDNGKEAFGTTDV